MYEALSSKLYIKYKKIGKKKKPSQVTKFQNI